jgi:hypothetical protein
MRKMFIQNSVGCYGTGQEVLRRATVFFMMSLCEQSNPFIVFTTLIEAPNAGYLVNKLMRVENLL